MSVLSIDKLKTGAPRFHIPLISWSVAYLLLWCYRSFFSIVGELVVMRLTPITDTRSYQRHKFTTAIHDLQQSGAGADGLMQDVATDITKLVGSIFGLFFFGSPILINIGFQTVGFIGIVVMLRAMDPAERKYFFVLLMLPSITVWSSIATKEALLFFLTGIICAHIINIYKNKDKIRISLILCVILLGMFKPHYLISLFFIFSVIYCARYFRQKTVIAVVALLASFAMLYIFRDIVDEFTTWVDFALAAMGGRSGRPQLLLEKYDVFYLAPYGIYLAFMGPTFQEMSIGVLHVFTFFESLIIVVILTLFMVRRLPDRPVFNLILSFGGLFWILFANYPLGLSNPGTAIRYRTGYILIVFLCAVTLQSRPLYADWVKGWRQRSGRRLLSIVWSSRKAPST